MAHPRRQIAAHWRWALLVLLMLGIFVGDRVLNGKIGAAHFEQMQQEFRTFPTPPNSEVTSTLNHFSVWNSHKATVGAAYSTQLRHSDIRDFYDRELVALGWRMLVADSGTDRSYCKGDFAALLRFDNNLPAGAEYVLSLDWPGNCR